MKKPNKFLRKIFLFVLLITISSAGVFFFSNNRSKGQPVFNWNNSNQVPMDAVLKINFPEEMNHQSVEEGITISPFRVLNFSWEEKTLRIQTIESFSPGENVTLTLKAGAFTTREIFNAKDLSWSFKIRSPLVLYLGQAITAPEVWVYNTEDDSNQPLTDTGGMVTGFTPLNDGKTVLYTKTNSKGGEDIYSVDLNKSTSAKLIDCGEFSCRDITTDSFGYQIAYSKNMLPGAETRSKDFFIYVYNLTTKNSVPLYPEDKILGTMPKWSPDGNKISIYDRNALGIRIKNSDGENDFLLGTIREQAGVWSADSNFFYFVDDIIEEGIAYSVLYEVDNLHNSLEKPLDNFGHIEEYGTPAVSPDGNLLALGVRSPTGGITKQMWIYNLSKQTRERITMDATFTNAAPQWRPDGEALIFQQAQLGVSGIKPRVMLWNKIDQSIKEIALDAALPIWMP